MREPELVGNSLVLVEERAVPDTGLDAHSRDPAGQDTHVAELLVATPPGAAIVALKPVVVPPEAEGVGFGPPRTPRSAPDPPPESTRA